MSFYTKPTQIKVIQHNNQRWGKGMREKVRERGEGGSGERKGGGREGCSVLLHKTNTNKSNSIQQSPVGERKEKKGETERELRMFSCRRPPVRERGGEERGGGREGVGKGKEKGKTEREGVGKGKEKGKAEGGGVGKGKEKGKAERGGWKGKRESES